MRCFVIGYLRKTTLLEAISMKKLVCAVLAVVILSAALAGCGSGKQSDPPAAEPKITAETAYEGVNNYCRSAYDWSVAEEDPSLMYLEMGEESETAYQVIFHSYTGADVVFSVDKTDGTTKMTEYVPALNLENDAGSFSLYEYLKTQD